MHVELTDCRIRLNYNHGRCTEVFTARKKGLAILPKQSGSRVVGMRGEIS